MAQPIFSASPRTILQLGYADDIAMLLRTLDALAGVRRRVTLFEAVGAMKVSWKKSSALPMFGPRNEDTRRLVKDA